MSRGIRALAFAHYIWIAAAQLASQASKQFVRCVIRLLGALRLWLSEDRVGLNRNYLNVGLFPSGIIRMQSSKALAVIVSLAVSCGGCSAIRNVMRGEPEIADSSFLVADLNSSPKTPELPTVCNNPEQISQPDDIRKCTEAMKQLVDVRWAHYADSLFGTTTSGTTAADAVVLGLNTAGAVTPSGATQILSAIAGGVTGLKATVNEDVLYKNSITLILLQMKKDRASWGTIIQKQLNAGANGYKNMYEAANDLYAYYRAGSWTEAIMSMQSDAGAQEAACQAELKNTKTTNATADTAATASSTVSATSQCASKPTTSAATTPPAAAIVAFAKGSVTADANAKQVIDTAVNTWKAGTKDGSITSIAIQGMADGANNSSNLSFAQKRSDAILSALEAAGIASAKITVLDPQVNGKRQVVISFSQ